jgi:hypothetical protein
MAIKLQTAELALPEAEEFREAVDRLKNDPGIGGRVSREAYMSAIARRDREYLGDPEEEPIEERWEKEYQRQEAACGFTYRGHLLRVCPICFSLPAMVRCYDCGLTTKLPDPR